MKPPERQPAGAALVYAVWSDLDQRLVRGVIADLTDEMQRRAKMCDLEADRVARAAGNAAGYLPRLFDCQYKLAEEWALRGAKAYHTAWAAQGGAPSGDLIRATLRYYVLPTISARDSAVASRARAHAARAGRPINEHALVEWHRRMSRLSGRLALRLEAEAAEVDYQTGLANCVRGMRPIESVGTASGTEFEELALEEARLSQDEDERVHPKVGALLVANGQPIARAHRGEIRGSHAEYIILEKKMPTASVADATLYTTLEPCVQRNDPRVPCADRICERGIRCVVIGMLDPNPDIRGLGCQRLRDAKIEIRFFTVENMGKVEDLNREFIRHHRRPRVN